MTIACMKVALSRSTVVGSLLWAIMAQYVHQQSAVTEHMQLQKSCTRCLTPNSRSITNRRDQLPGFMVARWQPADSFGILLALKSPPIIRVPALRKCMSPCQCRSCRALWRCHGADSMKSLLPTVPVPIAVSAVTATAGTLLTRYASVQWSGGWATRVAHPAADVRFALSLLKG